MATTKKFTSRIVKLGVVGVDSGQLVICDPSYIEGQFKTADPKEAHCSTHAIYKHKKTGKLYQFCYKNIKDFNSKPGRPDVIPFIGSYQDVMPEFGKSPTELIESKEFIETKLDPTPNVPMREFSYQGICKTTQKSINQGGQLNYLKGHAGAAVAFLTGFGDGVYEVFAEIVDTGDMGERIKKVWVDFITDEDLDEA